MLKYKFFEKKMPRSRDQPPAVRVYTVCDESRYLIVRNVPALGCGEDLLKLFGSYGVVEECKPMDEEECEPYTDVYWIKFVQVSNARFAKRKLDEFVFLGNRLKVSYAPHFENLLDTKEKLECRRREVLARLKSGRSKMSTVNSPDSLSGPLETLAPSQARCIFEQPSSKQKDYVGSENAYYKESPPITVVSSNQDYFSSPSMNRTVQLVREKLDKIQSSGGCQAEAPTPKKARVDNRRRI